MTTLSKLSAILKECRDSDINYLILGNGSNVLVSDDGYRGVVIRLDGDFRRISLVDDTTIYCGAGATLAALCKFALKCGLTGLEFAWGIPGTVGGAVFMNAGAYGGEMKDVVYSVSHMDKNGAMGRIEKDDLAFGYRTSVYRRNKCIITGGVTLQNETAPEDIRAKMDDYLGRRSRQAAAGISQCRQRVQASRGRLRRSAYRAVRTQGKLPRRRAGQRKARGLHHQYRQGDGA